jgi:hypothetical protein
VNRLAGLGRFEQHLRKRELGKQREGHAANAKLSARNQTAERRKKKNGRTRSKKPRCHFFLGRMPDKYVSQSRWFHHYAAISLIRQKNLNFSINVEFTSTTAYSNSGRSQGFISSYSRSQFEPRAL